MFVTHSVAEAVFLSTRIVVLAPNPGRIHAVLPVDLPWPRTAALRDTPEFERAGCASVAHACGRRDRADETTADHRGQRRWPFLPRCCSCGSSFCGSSTCRPTCCRRRWAVARAVGCALPFAAALALPSPPRKPPAACSPASLSASLIALIFAQSRWVRRMLYPYTLLLQTVPIVAIAPLILMWVGAGTPAVTLIAFIISLAPIIANTTQGLDQRRREPGASLPDAQRIARAIALQAAPAARGAVALCRNSHRQRHRGDRRDHRRTLCRLEPRGRRAASATPFSTPPRSCRPTICLRWCWRRRCWVSAFSFW